MAYVQSKCRSSDKIVAYVFLMWEITWKLLVAAVLAHNERSHTHNEERLVKEHFVVATFIPLLAILGVRFGIKLLKHLYVWFNTLWIATFTLLSMIFAVGLIVGPVKTVNWLNSQCKDHPQYKPSSEGEPIYAFIFGLVVSLSYTLYFQLQSHTISHILVHDAVEKMERNGSGGYYQEDKQSIISRDPMTV